MSLTFNVKMSKRVRTTTTKEDEFNLLESLFEMKDLWIYFIKLFVIECVMLGKINKKYRYAVTTLGSLYFVCWFKYNPVVDGSNKKRKLKYSMRTMPIASIIRYINDNTISVTIQAEVWKKWYGVPTGLCDVFSFAYPMADKIDYIGKRLGKMKSNRARMGSLCWAHMLNKEHEMQQKELAKQLLM
jgi:hypothetical protein